MGYDAVVALTSEVADSAPQRWSGTSISIRLSGDDSGFHV